eukprot:13615305-Alexandrium_andersonii.AAC.1
MRDAGRNCVVERGRKLRALVRTRRFRTDSELTYLYKARVLSFVEYRAPAICLAATTVLATLDALQPRFLRGVGVSEEDALLGLVR